MRKGEAKENRESKEFKYSIAVGSISFVFILGLVNYISGVYISAYQAYGIYLLIIILLMASINFLFSILMEGFSLMGLSEKINTKIKNIAINSFQAGLFFVLIAIYVYSLSFLFNNFVLWRLELSSIPEKILLALFLISILIVLILLAKFFDIHVTISIKKYFRAEALIIFFFILFLSWFGTIYIIQNSYSISIDLDKRYYDNRGQEICVPIVKTRGFASIWHPQEQVLLVYAPLEREGPKFMEDFNLHVFNEGLDEYEYKGTYYTSINLSSLEEGIYFVNFGVIRFGEISKTEILIVDKSNN